MNKFEEDCNKSIENTRLELKAYLTSNANFKIEQNENGETTVFINFKPSGLNKPFLNKTKSKDEFLSRIELLIREKTKGFEWVARDSEGDLYFFENKPHKWRNIWISHNGDHEIFYLPPARFLENVKWSDKEPKRIGDILDNYEVIK